MSRTSACRERYPGWGKENPDFRMAASRALFKQRRAPDPVLDHDLVRPHP